MKFLNQFKIIILGAVLVNTLAVLASDSGSGSGNVISYYSIRSQGQDLVRETVGWEKLTNLCDMDDSYWAWALVGQYSESFKGDKICHCLFGNDVIRTGSADLNRGTCNSDCLDCAINISGSCVTDRASTDWLADNFGLPTDFQSTITFNPKIKNFVADFQFYLGLDEFYEGLYIRLDLPVTWTRWTLDAQECIIDAGTNPYAPGYFSEAFDAAAPSNGIGIPRDQLYANASQFFTGSGRGNGEVGLNFIPPSDIFPNPLVRFDPLECGKWCNDRHKVGLADFHAEVGYNFHCDESSYFGLGVRLVAPTGNRPKGEFLFEPIVGNGHHWEVGLGLNAYREFWRSEETGRSFSVYVDGSITHMFDACQVRCFDLCSAGPNSRYMLAERFTPNIAGSDTDGLAGVNSAGVPTLSTLVFANEFTSVANLTMSHVNVSVGVQGEVSIKLLYDNDNGFNWSFGYDLWGHSCEKICRKISCANPDLSEWGLKGDAYVYGFFTSMGIQPNPLAPTESLATIHSGTNFPGVNCSDADAFAHAQTNPNIDNPQLAQIGLIFLPLFSQPTSGSRAQTSIQPVTLDPSDINLSGSSALSNRLYTHINWSWMDRFEDYVPFIGVGASVEFAAPNDSCGTSANCCSGSSDSNSDCCRGQGIQTCTRCSMSQWSVWIKGGMQFN